MISLILFFILLWSFYIGYSRGVVVQTYYTLGSVFSFILAATFFKKLAAFFYLWIPFANATQGSFTYYFDEQYLFELDRIFYAGLAFLMIYGCTYALVRFVGIFVHLANGLNPDTRMTNLISGGLSLVVTLQSLQIVLLIVSTIPMASVQNHLHNSLLANIIIQYLPIPSSFLRELWISTIVG